MIKAGILMYVTKFENSDEILNKTESLVGYNRQEKLLKIIF
jgi:hypothetical protein